MALGDIQVEEEAEDLERVVENAKLKNRMSEKRNEGIYDVI